MGADHAKAHSCVCWKSRCVTEPQAEGVPHALQKEKEGLKKEKRSKTVTTLYFIILQNKNVIIILIIIAFGATTYIIYRILIIQLLLIMIFLLPRQNRVKRSANRIPVGIEIQWWRMALHSVYKGSEEQSTARVSAAIW